MNADPETTLLMRCIEGVEDAAALLGDPALRQAIGRQLAALDPDAETRLTGTCPACGAACETVFDTAGFLLAEIVAYTDRLIDEVDQLARVYGWREADILALGAGRRRRYLELTS